MVRFESLECASVVGLGGTDWGTARPTAAETTGSARYDESQ